MASTPHILYAHREDEITSLLDAIDAQDALEVLLVVPREALVFRDLLNLKLLKRECEKLGKKLMISTEDSSGQALAKKAGIAVEILSEGEKFFEEWPAGSSRTLQAGNDGSPVSVSINPSSSRSMAIKPSVDDPMFSAPKRARAMDVVVPKTGTSLPQRSAETPSAPPARQTASFQSLREEGPREEDSRKERSEEPAAHFPGKRPLVVVLGVLVVLGGAVFGMRYIKPSATVTVYPKEDTVEFEMDLSGRTEIPSPDTAKAVVPLERFRADETITKEFPSSGNRDVVSRAHGKLTVYNAFGSASQPIVATTRFLSGSGKLFRTPGAVVIPGAKVEGGKLTPGSVEIEVVADQPGAEYNIPPSHFSIPGFDGTPKDGKFYAEGREPMAGGFKGTAHVVEKKDVEAAKAGFLPGELDRMKEVLRKKFPPDLTALDGALSATSALVSVAPKEGEPGEKFMLTVRTVAEALLFREQDVLGVVEPNIAENLGQTYHTLPETRKVSYTIRQYDPALGRLALTVLISVRRQAVILQDDIRTHLAGADINQAKTFFAGQDHIERVNLSLWPFWSRHLPGDASRIKIVTGKK